VAKTSPPEKASTTNTAALVKDDPSIPYASLVGHIPASLKAGTSTSLFLFSRRKKTDGARTPSANGLRRE